MQQLILCIFGIYFDDSFNFSILAVHMLVYLSANRAVSVFAGFTQLG